jgi:hypothetical protein
VDKNVGASSKCFGRPKMKGTLCWRVLKHGPHSPTKTLGHVRRLCCAAFPKLPVHHLRFLVHPGSFRCTPTPGRSARRDHSASCSRLHALPPWSCPCASHELSKSVTVGAPAEICDDRSSSIREDRSSRGAPYEDNRSPNPAAARTTDPGPSSCLSSS